MARASLVGQVLNDRYEVLEEIGRGALGIVYKGRHRLLDRPIAIKVLFDNYKGDDVNILRFEREAKSLSSLCHHNIVTVFDFGMSDKSFPYLVMDFIAGTTLHRVLKELGRIPVRRAVGIFMQICDAMEHAHGRGIIHRDIKPDNIILIETPQHTDHIKVVDFGIAKKYEKGHSHEKLTVEGQVVGTPAYMSPEQIMGQKLDARSDIYSVGCLMFQVLTGKLPIIGSSSMETMERHVSYQPMEFSQACPEANVPEGLQTVIFKSLMKYPEDRQETMAELKKNLQPFA